MGCSACNRLKKGNGYIEPSANDHPPLGASDIMIYDSERKETRKFTHVDWPDNYHKLILFFPETNTPACMSEMGALDEWIPEFDKLMVKVYAATTDPIHAIKDWYENDETLSKSKHQVLSSYLLPARLRILNGGRSKRASVFITKENDLVIQEHFLKVGRSLSELHRMYYAYTTDSYCAEGWTNPQDGYLNANSQES